eukprot:NODE_437_length_8620_cov_0.295857.p3 type:complete len:198 gc:universal NODE_437_length_8620_cov_0.295857:147-740(+)
MHSRYTIHSTCLLETVNGNSKTGYLIGSGTEIMTCSSFKQAELIKQVWPNQDVIGIFYSGMLDDSKVRPNLLFFNTTNYELHTSDNVPLEYTIISTKTEQAAINSCDTSDNTERLEFALTRYKSELISSSNNPDNISHLKSIVDPCSDDKLQEYCANLESLIECNIATVLLSQTQDIVDNMAQLKMSQPTKRFRKNK